MPRMLDPFQLLLVSFHRLKSALVSVFEASGKELEGQDLGNFVKDIIRSGNVEKVG